MEGGASKLIDGKFLRRNEMNIKTKTIGCLLGLSSLLMATQVSANTLSIIQTPNPAPLSPDTFNLTIQGNFTDTTDGGGFTLGWDTSVIDIIYDYTAIEASLVANGWDDATTGFSYIDAVTTDVSGWSTLAIEPVAFASSFTGLFDVVTLQFQATQAGSTNATLALDGFIGSNWTKTGDFMGVGVPVTYVGATINIQPVPVPAAVWLFGSGLIGLVGIARRGKQQSA